MEHEGEIIYHADDYGINFSQSTRIIRCVNQGKLNSISILPNGNELESCIKILPTEVKKSVHINLVEGYCCEDKEKIPLLVDEMGKFKHGFIGIWILSLLRPIQLREQLKLECKAQLNLLMKYLGDDYLIRIDSHMHCHMIPLVFDVLCELCEQSGHGVEYFRWPVEPLSLYLKNIRTWKRIRIINVVKVLIINLFSLRDRKYLKKYGLTDCISCFCGVMFSGKMTTENVNLVKSDFIDYAQKRQKNLEILFHPGGIKHGEYFLDDSGKEFVDFYTSDNRDLEAEALCGI